MKKITLLILVFLNFCLSQLLIAADYEKEFKEFFHSDVIGSASCGLNIQNFLKYLKSKGHYLKNGYIVSLHEDYGALNHFNARWGTKESYADGTSYYRDNWYFHVFAVFDGVAYDFSQRDNEVYSLSEYLTKSYIPSNLTQDIFLRGRLDREKALRSYFNLKMKIYRVADFETKLGPPLYEGRFFELFELAQIYLPANPPSRNLTNIPPFKKDSYGSIAQGEGRQYIIANDGRLGEITIYQNPYARLNDIDYPIEADAVSICHALGHLGTFPSYNKEEEITTQMAPFIHLSSSITPQNENEVRAEEDILLSFRYLLNDQKFWNYKKSTHVGCGNLRDAINLVF